MSLLKVVLVVLGLIYLCSGDTLYSMVTEFSGSKTETIVWVVSIDMKTGRVTNNTEAFVIAGSSATIDGISTFNQNKGIYYMATDYIVAFLYSANVATKTLLPTIYTYASYIGQLTWDPDTGNILQLGAYSNGMFVSEISQQRDRTVFQVPSTFNAGYIMVGTVNAGTYYLAGKIGSTSDPTYGLLSVNVSTGAIIQQVPISPSTCTIFPQRFFFYQGSIIGGALAFDKSELFYYFVKINPSNGVCTKTSLVVPTGVVTCWTFDTTRNRVIFAEAVSTGSYLHFFDVTTMKQEPPVFVEQQQIPESIEYSANF